MDIHPSQVPMSKCPRPLRAGIPGLFPREQNSGTLQLVPRPSHLTPLGTLRLIWGYPAPFLLYCLPQSSGIPKPEPKHRIRPKRYIYRTNPSIKSQETSQKRSGEDGKSQKIRKSTMRSFLLERIMKLYSYHTSTIRLPKQDLDGDNAY